MMLSPGPPFSATMRPAEAARCQHKGISRVVFCPAHCLERACAAGMLLKKTQPWGEFSSVSSPTQGRGSWFSKSLKSVAHSRAQEINSSSPLKSSQMLRPLNQPQQEDILHSSKAQNVGSDFSRSPDVGTGMGSRRWRHAGFGCGEGL